jgi:hypothetical protein
VAAPSGIRSPPVGSHSEIPCRVTQNLQSRQPCGEGACVPANNTQQFCTPICSGSAALALPWFGVAASPAPRLVIPLERRTAERQRLPLCRASSAGSRGEVTPHSSQWTSRNLCLVIRDPLASHGPIAVTSEGCIGWPQNLLRVLAPTWLILRGECSQVGGWPTVAIRASSEPLEPGRTGAAAAAYLRTPTIVRSSIRRSKGQVDCLADMAPKTKIDSTLSPQKRSDLPNPDDLCSHGFRVRQCLS